MLPPTELLGNQTTELESDSCGLSVPSPLIIMNETEEHHVQIIKGDDVGYQKNELDSETDDVMNENCILVKSTNTLKNNMNELVDVKLKRTSLKLTSKTINMDFIEHEKLKSQSDRIGVNEKLCNESNGIHSDKVVEHLNYDNTMKQSEVLSDVDNNRNSLVESDDRTSESQVIDTNNLETSTKFNDMANGNRSAGGSANSSPLSDRNRDSMASSTSEEYFICEKLKSAIHTKLRDSYHDGTDELDMGPVPMDTLLSPNEGPLCRRYAEIQFKNSKWNDTSQLRNRRMQLGSIDSDEDGGVADDDMQALLGNGLSRDDLSQSQVSLVSSSDGGILAGGETSANESSGDSTSQPCEVGLLERLRTTHNIWFLPGIQRAGAVHLLQGKEEGNFIVRGSSQPNTMAVSVRLPIDPGPYIEHYLIQSKDGSLSLESSCYKFESIPLLISHYAQCCDELPVQLCLPRALRDARNLQQLGSLALLGQEFWRYPMAAPRNSVQSPVQSSIQSKTESSGIGTTIFSGPHQQRPVPLKRSINNTSPKGNSILSPTTGSNVVNSQAGTPSDTASSLSSFTSTGGPQALVSPESIDSVVLTMSPVETNRTGIVGKTSTFKTIQPAVNKQPTENGNEKSTSFIGDANMNCIRAPRPTPPNTLSLAPLRTPPMPPPRWSKTPTPISPNLMSSQSDNQLGGNNFTVTTTVTFSVDGSSPNSPQLIEITSPTANQNAFQTISKRLSPEGECKTTTDSMSSHESKKLHKSSSRKLMSPMSVETPTGRIRRSTKARKESKHYQESDILESPQVYCRSALGDKISDYEDLWTQTELNNSIKRGGQLLSSFRPDGSQGKRPDLLPDHPTVTSLSGNLLSPAGSVDSSKSGPPVAAKPSKILSPIQDRNSMDVDLKVKTFQDNLKQQLNNLTIEDQRKVPNSFAIVHELQQQQQQNIMQPRNRLGLILPLKEDIFSPTKEMKTFSPSTPMASTPSTIRTKQGSPFYAEPADALHQLSVQRRVQRIGIPIPSNHRHSEPPKSGPLRLPLCQILSPTEPEKNTLAGSLDELKKKPKRERRRFDPWPVDSSWEFMGNDDDNESEANWKTTKTENGVRTLTRPSADTKENNCRKPLTVHQIIAAKMPELCLPDISFGRSIVNGQTFDRKYNENHLNVMNDQLGNNNKNRMSSYDNLERDKNNSNCYATTSLMYPESDDGTVFSEPWDSSQWDSFIPHDDTSETIHLSKCRSAICNSEDDTIMEDQSMTTNGNNRPPPKIATIIRSRSIRDREILSHPRNKSNTSGGPGESVRAYTVSLAEDKSSTFSQNIDHFITCTRESHENTPQVVMRNMRQFMSGMKNYLVKHGEADFQREVDRARSQLKQDEFLNLDTILESVMHQLVILPLREHLYGLFVDHYKRTDDLRLLADNITFAADKSPSDFGLPASMNVNPDPDVMKRFSLILWHLQEIELPLEKLDTLLRFVNSVCEWSKRCVPGEQMGADEFLPLLIYVVAKCGFIGAEIETEFMWGLLQPSLLSGETGYVLTAMSSAVQVLKNFRSIEGDNNHTIDNVKFESSSVLKVIIPDEYNGSLQTRTIPVRPKTTSKELCRIIAHKARITNPQDYALYILSSGEETIVSDQEYPQTMRYHTLRGQRFMFAYKRIDAKIAWPAF